MTEFHSMTAYAPLLLFYCGPTHFFVAVLSTMLSFHTPCVMADFNTYVIIFSYCIGPPMAYDRPFLRMDMAAAFGEPAPVIIEAVEKE